MNHPHQPASTLCVRTAIVSSKKVIHLVTFEVYFLDHYPAVEPSSLQLNF